VSAPDPAQIPNEQLLVAPCGPADRAEQARLFNACFKKSLSAPDLAWRYDQGPHGAALSFVTRPPGGEGISGYACSPRRVLCHGEHEARVGETGDVMTHPAWRKRGIFSSLDRACMAAAAQAGWPLVFGLPNRRSAHIFLELGWERIGTIRPWSFVLAGDARARAERLREGRLAALALPLSARRCARSEARLRRGGAGVTLRPLDRFPTEVEALSRQLERQHPFMVRRDAPYLDWRFLRNPSGLHQACGAFGADGRCTGYVVWQRPRPGEAVGFLVDLITAEPEPAAALVAAALAALRAAGASVVQSTAIDGSPWAAQLEGFGFLRPKAENHLIVIRYVHERSHPLVAASAQAARWFLTDGDRDDETMG
jgi:GNAT superfamily N-acetyltransferase